MSRPFARGRQYAPGSVGLEKLRVPWAWCGGRGAGQRKDCDFCLDLYHPGHLPWAGGRGSGRFVRPDGQPGADAAFVARMCSNAEMLGIDRDNEHHNSVAAAAAGVGAPVVEYRPQDRLLVLGYLEGRTLRDEDVADPATIPRIARACRRLHGGQRFAGDFDMFEVQRRYYAVVRGRGFRLPPGYDDLMPRFEAARRALAIRDEGTVPCNNDLLAGNFIDDGDRIWLIDYEYSGNNDACFELGNIGSECGLSEDTLAALVTDYYGGELRNRIARARLFGLVAKYGWTLWGSIQDATSPLGFDFWSWAMEIGRAHV